MKRLSAAWFLLVLLSLNACAQDDWLPLTAAIVRIQAGRSGGSGTLVWAERGEGYVVTCKHVVEGQRSATCVWRSGYQSAGPVVGLGQAYDTAVIRVTPPADAIVIPVAEEPVPQGAEVDCFGYGGQYRIPIQQVQLIRWRSPVRGYKSYGAESLIKLDANAQSGDSGGPILYRGELVGIVSGGELSSQYGRPVDSHGPYCTPIRNLLRAVAPHILVVGADAARQQQAQCGPNGCYPQLPRVPISAPAPSPRQVVPPVSSGPVQKSTPSLAPTLNALVEGQAKLDQRVSAIEQQIKALDAACANSASVEQLVSAIKRDPEVRTLLKGEAGATGPAGPAGPPGPPCQAPDLDDLVARVKAALPPVRMQILDSAGKVQQEQSKPLGDPIRLELVPVR